MSGFGERFRRAGYKTPKPLLVVEEKPIIAHIVDLFPGDHDFVFICNNEHLADKSLGLVPLLNSLAKSTNIVAIAPHKLGPIYAILQGRAELDLTQPTVVNYADFSCRWDFNHFVQDIENRSLVGSVPAYRGFHPHSAGSTNYAYIQETNKILEKIQEKRPFTKNKVEEFASSGTYYFKSAKLMLDLFEEQVAKNLSVGGEFYVSTSMGLMRDRGLRVGVYELDHFMQWGTPEDLEDYKGNSKLFRQLAQTSPASLSIRGTGPSLILASGAGSRFSGSYTIPKPLLKVSGKPMVSMVATGCAPDSFLAVSVSDDLTYSGMVAAGFKKVHQLPRVSSGQAKSAKSLVDKFRDDLESHFTIFPCDLVSAGDTGELSKLVGHDGNFLVVWVRPPTRFCRDNPEQFGWIWQSDNGISTAIKRAPHSGGARVMTGTFTFSSVRVFDLLTEALDQEDHTVAGEYYLDSFVELATKVGVDVFIFEPPLNISLGTPHEYRTFGYWQSCFADWENHPYSLRNDPFVNTRNDTGSGKGADQK